MEENRFYKQAFETVKENDCEVGDTVDAFNKKVNDSGVSPTVTTRPEGFKTAILVVDEPVIIEDFYKNRGNREYANTSPCLRADREGLKVVEPLVYDGFNQQVRADQTTVGCLTRNVGADLKRNGQGIIEPITEYELSDKMKKYINSYDDKYKVSDNNLVVNKVVAGAVTTREGSTRADASSYISKDFPENTNIAGKDMTRFRVRKLTERECFKLMGVKVEDFSKIRRNQSKSSCYHLAGDSIVSTVLMALFGQMLNIDWQEKVNKLVGEIADV
jgi:hypothetical protein